MPRAIKSFAPKPQKCEYACEGVMLLYKRHEELAVQTRTRYWKRLSPAKACNSPSLTPAQPLFWLQHLCPPRLVQLASAGGCGDPSLVRMPCFSSPPVSSPVRHYYCETWFSSSAIWMALLESPTKTNACPTLLNFCRAEATKWPTSWPVGRLPS